MGRPHAAAAAAAASCCMARAGPPTRSLAICRPPRAPHTPPQVYGLPTLILFKDGQEVPNSKREGAVTKALLQDYLAKHKLVAK